MDWLMDRLIDVFSSPFQPSAWLEVGYDGSEFNQISDLIGTGTSEISVDVFGWFTGKAIQLGTYELDPMLPIEACR